MILKSIESYAKLAQTRLAKYDDDDVVEKLIRKFSAIMMVIFASIFGITQLVGNPIQCWCPNEYSGSRCEYAKIYCYITNLYVPINNSSHLPRRDDLQSHKILYYQWIPFIFSLQAVLFYFPSMVWRALNSKSGFDINGYVQELNNDNSGVKDSPGIRFVTHHIETCLVFKKNYHHRGNLKNFVEKRLFNKLFNKGFYLSFCYLTIKNLYLLSVFIQMYLLNNWLIDEHYSSKTNWIFGSHLFNLEERFPRKYRFLLIFYLIKILLLDMTLCKFNVYILTDPQLHWLQCTLPINVFLRKVFLIVYLWLIVLFLLIILDIFKYLIFLFNGKKFVANLINEEKINEENLDELCKSLKADGLVVLKLLKSNTNSFNASAIANNLYQIEAKKYK